MLIVRENSLNARRAILAVGPGDIPLEEADKLAAQFRSDHGRSHHLPVGDQDDLALREVTQLLGCGYIDFRGKGQGSDQMVAHLEYWNGNHIEQPIPDADGIRLLLRAEGLPDDFGSRGFKFREGHERISFRAGERLRLFNPRIENHVQLLLAQQLFQPTFQRGLIGLIELRLIARFIGKISVTQQEVLTVKFLRFAHRLIGHHQAARGFRLELPGDARVQNPNCDAQQEHHRRDHRRQHFRAKTQLRSHAKLFHFLKAWAGW